MKTTVLKNIWRAAVILLLNLMMIALVTGQVPGQSLLAKLTKQSSDAASVETLSRYGSRGTEVRQIQTRLRDLGFYSGSIDGVFGSVTQSAVTSFQRSRGLTADGIAGPRTLAALGISGGSGGYSASDINLLARVISAESRGEPYSGQVAVGAVILNRVGHPSFPNTLAGVIYQPGAFTAIVDGQINQPVSDSARRAAQDAINGWDPSGGAIYYYNPAKTTNRWIYSRPVITIIGKHRFCS